MAIRAHAYRGAWSAWLAVAGLLACAAPLWNAPVWDAAEFARDRPELTGRPLGRLGDATPYLLPADDTLHLFLCRWSLEAPLTTSLPPDASAEEQRLLERVLVAWEQAVPGLRFAIGADAPVLRLIFAEGGRDAATTAARCQVAPPFDRDETLDARLVEAEVRLRREERDAWGWPRALSDAELAGSVAHELAHALGLQGHVTSGPSALRRDSPSVRRRGERLLSGEPLAEPAAAALYALPSGVRIGARPLPSGATAAVDALTRAGEARGARVVVLQLGDAAQRGAWDVAPELAYYLRDPAEVANGTLDFGDALVLADAPPRVEPR